MSNETNETIVDIVAEMRDGVVADGWMEQTLREFADRIEAAAKREMADEKRISDAVVQYLRDKKLEMAGEIAAKDAAVSTLRALVGEMADALDTTIIVTLFVTAANRHSITAPCVLACVLQKIVCLS